jgi:uncharacterized membrane protein YagU involved in acid resistance
MVSYKFKVPNLVEFLLFVAVAAIVAFGFWILAKAFAQVPEIAQLTIQGVIAIFLWLALVLLGIIAIEIESTREFVREIYERLNR